MEALAAVEAPALRPADDEERREQMVRLRKLFGRPDLTPRRRGAAAQAIEIGEKLIQWELVNYPAA